LSRTRRAGITAVFGYLQFALALVSGIAMVPFVLRSVGAESYGVWLAFGELLAYSSMVDLGVVGVLPWMIAESDGRGDRAHMRTLLAGALVFSAAAAVLFAALALLLLHFAPGMADLTPAQRAGVAGPVLLLIAGMGIGFPLRAFYATVIGLQDVVFVGAMSIAQLALGISLTLGLLLGGFGLYALAAAAAVPGLLAGVVCLARLRKLAPDLLRGWSLPPWRELRAMTAQGLGGWSSGLGWRMVAASDSMVILAVAGPQAAVVYAMTLKLGAVGMQMSWQLPDSGLVGLAQLKGEGRPERVREITVVLLRLTLLASGGVACAVLAFNPAFVRLWVGPSQFGGLALNALLAGVILAHSLGHGLFTISATLGTRVQAGWASLAQGAVNLGAAFALGSFFGLEGVAAAALVSTALVAYPAGAWMVRKTTGMRQRDLWRDALGPWLVRGLPLLALGAAVGSLAERVSPWLPLALAPALAALYLWTMRPLFAGMPLPTRVRSLLARVRLVPA
jgi:O-antigen/teichoic acid export membrane protein